MKHRFQSAKAGSSDTTLVDSVKWNDVLITSIIAVSTNTSLTSAHDCVKVTTGASAITITLPTSVGIQGQVYKIMKVDAGAGAVTVATTASQTINGSTTHILSNQWQFVEVTADETSNWIATDGN